MTNDYWESLFAKLREAGDRRREQEENVRLCVYACRKAGMPWDAIGEALGISRQAAWEKFRHVELGA